MDLLSKSSKVLLPRLSSIACKCFALVIIVLVLRVAFISTVFGGFEQNQIARALNLPLVVNSLRILICHLQLSWWIWCISGLTVCNSRVNHDDNCLHHIDIILTHILFADLYEQILQQPLLL